MKFDRQLQPAT